MNIVHYLPRIRLEEGGVVRAVLDICALLPTLGHDVTLLSYDPRDLPEAWKEGGADTPRVRAVAPPGLPGGLFSGSQLRELAGLIEGADVLHLHTPWERGNIQLASVSSKRGKPYVLTIHGMLDDWAMSIRGPKKRVYLALFAKRLLERAAMVHCTAESEQRQSSRWFPRGRSRVIPLVCDLSPFRELPGTAAAREAFPPAGSELPKALFLSRFHPGKRVELLIEAVALLRSRGVEMTLLLAGGGDDRYEAELRSLVRTRGLEDRAAFLGIVTGDLKVSLYQAADVFVLPSIHENFGLVAPEAMAAGTPVVTTRGVSIWAELEASGGAKIVEATPEAIAEAVDAVVASPDRGASMGEAGRRWVFECLDGARVIREYERLYEDVARGQFPRD